jgi:cytochrome P450
VLVHAEIDGEKLEETEIVMGFFLLMGAGNDSTKATFCSGMRALLEDPEQKRRLLEGLLSDPERGRGGTAHVPSVRTLPSHGDVRYLASRAEDPRGRGGGHVVRLLKPR